MSDDYYSINDKRITPFLLVSSEVRLIGTQVDQGSVYFNFAPVETVVRLISQFLTNTAKPIQPRVLMDAIETYRDVVHQNLKYKKT